MLAGWPRAAVLPDKAAACLVCGSLVGLFLTLNKCTTRKVRSMHPCCTSLCTLWEQPFLCLERWLVPPVHHRELTALQQQWVKLLLTWGGNLLSAVLRSTMCPTNPGGWELWRLRELALGFTVSDKQVLKCPESLGKSQSQTLMLLWVATGQCSHDYIRWVVHEATPAPAPGPPWLVHWEALRWPGIWDGSSEWCKGPDCAGSPCQALCEDEPNLCTGCR